MENNNKNKANAYIEDYFAFNPFDFLYSAEDCFTLAEILVGNDEDLHDEKVALYAATILYLYFDSFEETRTLSNILTLLKGGFANKNHSYGSTALDTIFDGLEKRCPDSLSLSLYNCVRNSSEWNKIVAACASKICWIDCFVTKENTDKCVNNYFLEHHIKDLIKKMDPLIHR